MRILHTESSRSFGGQELRIVEEMEWFQKHGHHVWLAAAPGSDIAKTAGEHGIECVPATFRGSINIGAIIKLTRFCRRHHIGLIVSHSSRDSFNAAIVSRLARISLVRCQHICMRLKDSFIYRLAWRAPKKIVAVAESIKRRLVGQKLAHPDRIEVLGEYVDVAKFHPGVSPDDVRLKHGIPQDATLITQIGMIRMDKGQKFLVLAADEILQKHPHCWFMFVGSATKEKFMDELMEAVRSIRHPERIVFAGFQSRLPPYIAASDIICLSSLLEAQSKIIPQAFAMRKLVVASNVGGIPELVRHGENGLLYKKGNAAELAKAIDQALSRDASSMITAAFKTAQSLAMDPMMERTEKFYESLTA